jgi:hypothetical protein
VSFGNVATSLLDSTSSIFTLLAYSKLILPLIGQLKKAQSRAQMIVVYGCQFEESYFSI